MVDYVHIHTMMCPTSCSFQNFEHGGFEDEEDAGSEDIPVDQLYHF